MSDLYLPLLFLGSNLLLIGAFLAVHFMLARDAYVNFDLDEELAG